MARKKIVRKLPPLPKGPVLRAKDHKAERLLEILRGIAVANQKEQPQPFYPVRDVARRFQVPVSTVARVYDRLEEEGILSSIRGSRTLLQGLGAARHISVRSYVGMPAAVSYFVALQNYRTFFIRTRRELRARGFAVTTVFFEPRELETAGLEEKFKKYGVDTVLWYLPDVAARDAVARLRDQGVRFICISEGGSAPIRCHYEIHRANAINAILKDWRAKDRIKSVVIVRGLKRSAAAEERLAALLEDQEVACESVKPGNQQLERFLESLGDDRSRGIIFPAWAASLCGFRAPEALIQLMNRSRVAFVDGPVTMPFTKVIEAPVDLVTVNWQLLAERVVDDLTAGDGLESGEPIIFEADPHLRVPLSEFAQSI
jgi:hypothetical protein